MNSKPDNNSCKKLILGHQQKNEKMTHKLCIKASCEISVPCLKNFWAKVEKCKKTHKLCLINPSWYSFLEKAIFDLKTGRPR